jgi:hypothetical protein
MRRASTRAYGSEMPKWGSEGGIPRHSVWEREESARLSFRRPHKGGKMKKQILSLVGVLSLMLVAGSALAQNEIRADVPFNFNVNRTAMPAGQYSVTTIGTGDTLLIQSKDKKAVKLVTPNRAETSEPAKSTKLVFHCYGKDQCFLYQIWVEGRNRGRQLPKSSLENEIEARLRSRDVPVIASAR